MERGNKLGRRREGKVGFVFSTKDRVNLTRRSLKSIDAEKGFDLIWLDGSDSTESKEFPKSVKLNNCRLSEIHYGIRGSADNAIRFGLRRLLALGYDYCGLIENDIEFIPGWYRKLMELFALGKRDSLDVGAVTIRNIQSRVICYCGDYSINWNMGAGMVLFTNEAARSILANYYPVTSKGIAEFYQKNFGLDLGNIWELWWGERDRDLGYDWAFAMQLYRHGLCSLGSIPTMAYNIDDNAKALHLRYVSCPDGTGGLNESSLLLLKSRRAACSRNTQLLLQLKTIFCDIKFNARRYVRKVFYQFNFNGWIRPFSYLRRFFNSGNK